MRRGKGAFLAVATILLLLTGACAAKRQADVYTEANPRPPLQLLPTENVPDAREIARRYGPLKGTWSKKFAAGALQSLSVTREWTFKGADGEIQVAEWLVQGEPVRFHVDRTRHVDPLASIRDEEVEYIMYGFSLDGGLLVNTPQGLQALLTAIRTQSTVRVRTEAWRTFLDASGRALGGIEGGVEGGTHGCTMGVWIRLKSGGHEVFSGHAEAGDFNGIRNWAIREVLFRHAVVKGKAPPGFQSLEQMPSEGKTPALRE